MREKICETCTYNDDGFCDRKGILVEDEDTCEKYQERALEIMLDKFLRGSRK